jgi:GNAT superfamily N-acetyltransferase
MKPVIPSNLIIRNELRPGDLGTIIHLHGVMYAEEYNYGISFESYVASGLAEFYRQYDPERDRVWIVEDEGRIVGFLLLMHRGEKTCQLRYYLLLSPYRGMGIGKKLMEEYMQWMDEKGYDHSYLWTTNELPAAASLYTRYGFTLSEEKPSDAFGKPVIEQRYDWYLSPGY